MIVLGLTGSIGMGKSTTATMFREAGVPVHDADEAVHRLYSGPLAADIETLFPGTTRNGVVDRKALGATVLGEPDRLRALEALVHPAVRAEEKAFLDAAHAKGAEVVVLDIPLLFETGRDKDVDAIVVVSAPDHVQRERVLARPEMTEEKFAAILGRQTPDSEKRARADYIVDSGQGLEKARADVAAILAALSTGNMGKGQR